MDGTITGSGALFYSIATKRFLLLHRAKEGKTSWGLAGGKTEGEETPWEGLKRELTEEIGEVDIIKTIPLESFISNDEKFFYHTYLCVVKEEFIPKLNWEHDGYAWVSLGRWPKPLHTGLANTFRNRMNKTKIETALKLIHEILDVE